MVNRELLDDPRFKELFDFVFIDEKWFYLSQKSERYYLLPKEDDPHRTCKNKNYIPRLMCVCARPRFRDENCIFFMVELVVFHLFDINRLTKVMREPAVFVETWL